MEANKISNVRRAHGRWAFLYEVGGAAYSIDGSKIEGGYTKLSIEQRIADKHDELGKTEDVPF